MEWALAILLAVLGFPFAVAGAIGLFIFFMWILFKLEIIS